MGCLREPRDRSVELAESTSVEQAVDDSIAAAVLVCVIWLGSNIIATGRERWDHVVGCL